jgi:hypothetical protein
MVLSLQLEWEGECTQTGIGAGNAYMQDRGDPLESGCNDQARLPTVARISGFPTMAEDWTPLEPAKWNTSISPIL